MAIVGMTVIVRLLILPLTIRQIKSMNALRELQPQVKELQEKYKDDSQRMNQEMMKFYKENKVNPLASCLPLLLQLPVFIALFQLLRSDEFADELHASPPAGLAVHRRPRGAGDGCHAGDPDRALRRARRWRRRVVMSVSAPTRRSSESCCCCRSHSSRSSSASRRPGRVLDHDQLLDVRASRSWCGRSRPRPTSRPSPAEANGSGVRPARRDGRRGCRQKAAAAAAQEEAAPALGEHARGLEDRGPEAGRADERTSTPLGVEAEGSSAGEAKWAAMKELERAYPGPRCRATCEFDDAELGTRRGPDEGRGRGRPGGMGGGETGVRLAERAGGASAGAAAAGHRPPRPARERRRRGGRGDADRLGQRLELGLLIGKRGQTIDALQFLCSQAAYRGHGRP